MSTQIKFYILQPSTISSQDTVLNFACKLTQIVLARSQYSLIIVDADRDRLSKLDALLWAFDPTSFIPHELFLPKYSDNDVSDDVGDVVDVHDGVDAIVSDKVSDDFIDNIIDDIVFGKSPKNDKQSVTLADLTAPVTLVTKLPKGFDGVVLNLGSDPLILGRVQRVLEIIAPDEHSAELGRNKVRYYRGFDVDITYHTIKS